MRLCCGPRHSAKYVRHMPQANPSDRGAEHSTPLVVYCSRHEDECAQAVLQIKTTQAPMDGVPTSSTLVSQRCFCGVSAAAAPTVPAHRVKASAVGEGAASGHVSWAEKTKLPFAAA